MLVPLIPDQVVQHWDIIAPNILRSLPPGYAINTQTGVNILRAIMAEEAVVWLWYDNPEDLLAVNPTVGVLTGMQVDRIMGAKSLFIYALYAFGALTNRDIWQEGIATLSKYAKESGCSFIRAYTDIPQLADFLAQSNWGTSFTLLTKEV